MDESWRMRMGLMPELSRRRSMEDRSSSRTKQSIFSGGLSGSETLDPDDFADVFGGPPRTLLVHKFSRSSSFYEEVFRLPEFVSPATESDRNLPFYSIPTKNEAFYSDIFGSDDDRKSRERSASSSKAKSQSNSSVLSSEELSPLWPAIGADVRLSAFASKFRPINVPCRWKMLPEEYPTKQEKPPFPCSGKPFEAQYLDNEYKENFKSSHFGFSRRVSSPETVSLESNSYQSIKVSTDDWELNSPFSVVSPLCQEHETKSSIQDHVLPRHVIEQGDDDEEDEVMSSYVIEINSNLREEDNIGAAAIDEAIAWAKEKFTRCSDEESSSMRNDSNEQAQEIEDGRPNASEFHHDGIGRARSPKNQLMETEKLDRDIRLWSSGKETDIRLLLTTLHDILWPDSGWYAVPLMNLIESSHVKKAYQKAILCLHPDKLQQRETTLQQKYVAERAFSILQDAWAAFISEDVSF